MQVAPTGPQSKVQAVFGSLVLGIFSFQITDELLNDDLRKELFGHLGQTAGWYEWVNPLVLALVLFCWAWRCAGAKAQRLDEIYNRKQKRRAEGLSRHLTFWERTHVRAILWSTRNVAYSAKQGCCNCDSSSPWRHVGVAGFIAFCVGFGYHLCFRGAFFRARVYFVHHLIVIAIFWVTFVLMIVDIMTGGSHPDKYLSGWLSWVAAFYTLLYNHSKVSGVWLPSKEDPALLTWYPAKTEQGSPVALYFHCSFWSQVMKMGYTSCGWGDGGCTGMVLDITAGIPGYRPAGAQPQGPCCSFSGCMINTLASFLLFVRVPYAFFIIIIFKGSFIQWRMMHVMHLTWWLILAVVVAAMFFLPFDSDMAQTYSIWFSVTLLLNSAFTVGYNVAQVDHGVAREGHFRKAKLINGSPLCMYWHWAFWTEAVRLADEDLGWALHRFLPISWPSISPMEVEDDEHPMPTRPSLAVMACALFATGAAAVSILVAVHYEVVQLPLRTCAIIVVGALMVVFVLAAICSTGEVAEKGDVENPVAADESSLAPDSRSSSLGDTIIASSVPLVQTIDPNHPNVMITFNPLVSEPHHPSASGASSSTQSTIEVLISKEIHPHPHQHGFRSRHTSGGGAS